MTDLTPMSSAEARHLRDLAEAWETYGPALRAKLALDGGMTWKTVHGADYLCRYRPDPDHRQEEVHVPGPPEKPGIVCP